MECIEITSLSDRNLSVQNLKDKTDVSYMNNRKLRCFLHEKLSIEAWIELTRWRGYVSDSILPYYLHFAARRLFALAETDITLPESMQFLSRSILDFARLVAYMIS